MHLTEAQLTIIRSYFATRPVKRAWLFGSYARGEADEQSDVDLLVDLDYSQHIGWKIGGWLLDLQKLLGRNIDLVPESSLYPNLRRFVDADKQLVYEKLSKSFALKPTC